MSTLLPSLTVRESDSTEGGWFCFFFTWMKRTRTRLFKDLGKQRRNATDLEMSGVGVSFPSSSSSSSSLNMSLRFMSGLSSCTLMCSQGSLVTELMVHILQMFYSGALKGKEGKFLMSVVFLDLRTQDIICVSVFHPAVQRREDDGGV